MYENLIRSLEYDSIQNSSPYFLNLWVQLSSGSAFPQPDKNGKFLRFFIIFRECGSNLYVGLAHTAPPTNTNFQLSFQLTQLQEALYED